MKIYDSQQAEIESITIDDTNKEDIGIYFYNYTIPTGEGDLYFEFEGLINNNPIITRKKIQRRFY